MLHAAAKVNDDGEYARSPEKKEARDRAALFGNVLKDERERNSKDSTPSALAEGVLERIAWRQDVKIAPLSVSQETEGWKGTIAKAIRGALVSSYSPRGII